MTHVGNLSVLSERPPLLFSVSFSVCGAEGGGISAFDGVYVVSRNARKSKITPEVTPYWFYFTNILRQQDALRQHKQHLCISWLPTSAVTAPSSHLLSW